MKLLFDQNLSFRLVATLQAIYPGSLHVRELGFDSVGDEIIWNYAARNGFVIVSKDSDFRQRSFLRGAPPKVIWIRRGNCPTSEIVTMLQTAAVKIEKFMRDEESTFLILD